MISINNQIITMNRGDTFVMPLVINKGTKYAPDYYIITEDDTIYFAVEEYNQCFENALIKKVFDLSDVVNGNVIIKLESEDTQFILPGEYYYEIKLKHIEDDGTETPPEYIETIVPRRKFIIIE